jgi:hypothetical protein
MNEQNEKPIILVIVTFFLVMTLVYIVFLRQDSTVWSWDNITSSGISPTWLQTVSSGTDISLVLSWSLSGFSAWVGTGSSSLLSWQILILLSWLLAKADISSIDALDQWKRTTEWWWLSWDSGSSGVNIGSWSVWSMGVSRSVPSYSLTSWLIIWWVISTDIFKTISQIKPRYWSIEVAQTLWLTIKQAFVDTWSIQYGYLGTGSLDSLAATVRRLWWNVLAIEAQNDINKNLLRWDRILFVNIPKVTFVTTPSERKILVAMIVIVGSDKRFIETTIERYHASKPSMRAIFEQLYWKKL